MLKLNSELRMAVAVLVHLVEAARGGLGRADSGTGIDDVLDAEECHRLVTREESQLDGQCLLSPDETSSCVFCTRQRTKCSQDVTTGCILASRFEATDLVEDVTVRILQKQSHLRRVVSLQQPLKLISQESVELESEHVDPD